MDAVNMNAVFSLLDPEKKKMLLAQVLSSNYTQSLLPANASTSNAEPAAKSADSQENQQDTTSYTADEMLSSGKTAANNISR
ncbi:hypothetical protein ACROYT_G015695 [Oculina patagonica]